MIHQDTEKRLTSTTRIVASRRNEINVRTVPYAGRCDRSARRPGGSTGPIGMIEDYAIRYAPSLTVLHLTRLWEQTRPKPSHFGDINTLKSAAFYQTLRPLCPSVISSQAKKVPRGLAGQLTS